ncbi:MAG: phosphoglycerate dehydrogenase, partial [Planctomycetota bacterium]
VGVANIDVNYATEKGILVINTPGKNTNSAAELTIALLLAATRKVVGAHQTMDSGGWDRHRFSGMELMNKTIGIIGLGNVGHRVARFGHGFDMRVLAYDPYISEEVFGRHRAESVDLDTLLSESDIITVHTPKNKETTGMIGSSEIAKMKKGVVVINAARGGIVEEKAMLDGLKSGHISCAGIDTWDNEPMSENPFAGMEQVVMSPHIGASTAEAQHRIGETIAEEVPRALRGGIVNYPVNMPAIRMIEGDLMTTYTVLVEKLGKFTAQFIDFDPEKLTITYRGDIAKNDCTILRLAFLKGMLGYSHDFVSYVNAEQRAESVGIKVEDCEDPGFTDYENAVKFSIKGKEKEFSIGGVVFSGPHPRITLVDGFNYEEKPEGRLLIIRCRERFGVVSAIADLLDKNNILIENFSFSYSKKARRNMFMIRIGRAVSSEVLHELNNHEDITLVKAIEL